MRNKYLPIFAICLAAAVAVLAYYQSLSHPSGGPTSSTAHWTEYVLTRNGNHTQLQSSYSDGGSNTEQILWLNFDNRTAVYHYFGCTPSMPGCTLDGCSFTVLNDTASEYRVKVYCAPGARIVSRALSINDLHGEIRPVWVASADSALDSPGLLPCFLCDER